MVITGTMDAAMEAEKIGRHKLAGINLTEQAKPAPAPVMTTKRAAVSCSSPMPRSSAWQTASPVRARAQARAQPRVLTAKAGHPRLARISIPGMLPANVTA